MLEHADVLPDGTADSTNWLATSLSSRTADDRLGVRLPERVLKLSLLELEMERCLGLRLGWSILLALGGASPFGFFLLVGVYRVSLSELTTW